MLFEPKRRCICDVQMSHPMIFLYVLLKLLILFSLITSQPVLQILFLLTVSVYSSKYPVYDKLLPGEPQIYIEQFTNFPSIQKFWRTSFLPNYKLFLEKFSAYFSFLEQNIVQIQHF